MRRHARTAANPHHWPLIAATASPIESGAPNQIAPEEGAGRSTVFPQATVTATRRQPITVAFESIGAHKPKPVNTVATTVPSTAAAPQQTRPRLRVVRIEASTASRLSPVRCPL